MIKFCATGDSIIMRPLPDEYKADTALRDFIMQSELRAGNMEMTLTNYDVHASTFCGGTWLTGPATLLDELDYFGFQFYNFANNHTMDYSYGGLRSTIEAFKAHGVEWAGAGESLAEASCHKVLKAQSGETVGIVCVTSTSDDSSRAGDAHGSIPARPGLNLLRHKEVFRVNAQHMQALREIADATHINGRINNSKKGGYTLSDPGTFSLGAVTFAEDENEGKSSMPNKVDMERIAESVRKAKAECDYVVVIMHSHEIKGETDNEPDYFIETFAHESIDAGADAIICSGTHQLKAVELYKERPIFYSIGNFIFQSDKIAYLPADFYEKYSVPLHYSAAECLAVRSANGTRGLQTDINNYLALVPQLIFDEGKVREINIQPIALNFHAENKELLKGLPTVADEESAGRIYDLVAGLSREYNTELKLENGLIKVVL